MRNPTFFWWFQRSFCCALKTPLLKIWMFSLLLSFYLWKLVESRRCDLHASGWRAKLGRVLPGWLGPARYSCTTCFLNCIKYLNNSICIEYDIQMTRKAEYTKTRPHCKLIRTISIFACLICKKCLWRSNCTFVPFRHHLANELPQTLRKLWKKLKYCKNEKIVKTT